MPLSVGDKFGPYEILGPLGAGGMGEVYRAKDIKLKREVALKVLPDTFARDPERMARFEREAQVLASLNHPNIAAIYGLEGRALIMELVEGQTLSSPLPVETAARYARQIADALEYAHERGVIHRDLKPANIIVTSEGIAKLLDFGLAKAIENPNAAPHEPGNSPTLTLGVTTVGVILGTAAYMSPEQAGGKIADRRADVLSFGVVFYEMLSGKRAFEGESAAETLANVLKVDPDWSALPPATPASIRKLMRRCLVKDRKQRLQAIGEARIVLQATPEEISAPAGASRRSIVPWMAATGVLAIAAAIGWWTVWRSSRPVDHPLVRLSVDLGPDAVAPTNITAAISPDGSRLVFSVRGPDGKTRLATRLLDQPQATLLTGTEGAVDPFFKPDGEWIGFFAEGKMKKVSVRGSAVIVLCDVLDARGAAWGEDDSIFVTLDSNVGVGLSSVPAAAGNPRPVTNPADRGEATHRWPQVLPGGHAVLFTGAQKAAAYDDSNIEVLSLKTGAIQVVQRGGYFGRYLANGYLVYIHDGTLFGVPFDSDRLKVQGRPVPLQEDVAGSPGTAGGQFDVSHNGTMVYRAGKASPDTFTLEWLDATGKTQPLLSMPALYLQPRLSPDGKRLAYSNNVDIEIYDLDRGTRARLNATGQAFDPVWTPDGKHIAFQSQGVSSYSLRWMRADGAGESIVLWESRNAPAPYSFSPDGRRLAFSEQNAEKGSDLWMLPLDTGDSERPKPCKPELFLGAPFSQRSPAFSPDGRRVAYESNESGRNEVYVRSFSAGGPSGLSRSLISTDGGRHPMWSHDGQQLFYEAPDHRIMAAAYRAKGDAFSAAKPRPWSSPLAHNDANWNLDGAPDGKRFVIAASPHDRDQKGSVHVTFLLNFFDEVRRRIPAGK